jgi:hypothetical protein
MKLGEAGAINIEAIPTGALSLDIALGIPFCCIDVSQSSSCHTYPRLSIIAMACSVSSCLSPNSLEFVPEDLKQ